MFATGACDPAVTVSNAPARTDCATVIIAPTAWEFCTEEYWIGDAMITSPETTPVADTDTTVVPEFIVTMPRTLALKETPEDTLTAPNEETPPARATNPPAAMSSRNLSMISS